jgi:hypothetical protein
MTKSITSHLRSAAIGASALVALTGVAKADQVIADDLIVQFSLCVGNDCVSGETFGFDTIRIKENNTRIKFEDTSTAGSFPSSDWQLTANDSANGGAEKFSIDDVDNGRSPFTITGGARANSIFVSSAGRVGFGTASPVVDLHVVQGNTPTMRLQQDGSSGFAEQTWDVAGNESGFFVRDVTNGSQLPFRIIPGADSSSLAIGANNNVGIGAGTTPDAPLEISRNESFIFMRLTAQQATNPSADVTYTGGPLGTGQLRYNIVDGDSQEMSLDANGNMIIAGQLTTAGSCSIGCDRVFDKDYDLKSLEEHNQAMWSQGYLPNVGPTAEDGPFNVSDKMGRMLNELEHAHIYIGQLNERIAALEANKLAD